MTAIEHENVVQVVEADTDPTQQLPFIVMELLQGLPFDGWLRINGPLNPVAAARPFIQGWLPRVGW